MNTYLASLADGADGRLQESTFPGRHFQRNVYLN